MFKKANYNKRALSTFEIIGSFVVDLYYNHFYQEAKRLHTEGRSASITDGYKHAIKAYIRSLGKPESYRKTIVGIHKYYYTTTRFTTISFSDCIDDITKHFVPDEFFEATSNKQRDNILRTVLTNSIKQFSSDVLCSNILDTLIDNHSDTFIVRNMQDKMVQALMFEREKMFQRIFNVQNKPSGGGGFDVIMKMKAEMIKLVKKNHLMATKYDKLKEKTLELLNKLHEQSAELKALQEPANEILAHAENIQHAEQVQEQRASYDEYNPPGVQDTHNSQGTAPDNYDTHASQNDHPVPGAPPIDTHEYDLTGKYSDNKPANPMTEPVNAPISMFDPSSNWGSAPVSEPMDMRPPLTGGGYNAQVIEEAPKATIRQRYPSSHENYRPDPPPEVNVRLRPDNYGPPPAPVEKAVYFAPPPVAGTNVIDVMATGSNIIPDRYHANNGDSKDSTDDPPQFLASMGNVDFFDHDLLNIE
jgi:hypothetical protein